MYKNVWHGLVYSNNRKLLTSAWLCDTSQIGYQHFYVEISSMANNINGNILHDGKFIVFTSFYIALWKRNKP